MTSVDTDSELCAKERSAFLQRLGVWEMEYFQWTRTKERILTTNGKINKKKGYAIVALLLGIF